MLRRAHCIIFLIIILTSFISSIASANPVVYPPYTGNILADLFFVFIINLPINLLMYMGILWGILFLRKRKEYYKKPPKIYYRNIIFITIIASLLGAIIDWIFIFGIYEMVLHVFFTGAFLVFLSFFVLAKFINELKLIDALIIGSIIGLLNITIWIINVDLYYNINVDLIIISLLCYPLSIYFSFAFSLWYGNKYRKFRTAYWKKLLNLVKMNEVILTMIAQASTIHKKISIVFTNRRILITNRLKSENINPSVPEDQILKQYNYSDIEYIFFKMSLFKNNLVLKTKYNNNKYYCDSKGLVEAIQKLEPYLDGLII